MPVYGKSPGFEIFSDQSKSKYIEKLILARWWQPCCFLCQSDMEIIVHFIPTFFKNKLLEEITVNFFNVEEFSSANYPYFGSNDFFNIMLCSMSNKFWQICITFFSNYYYHLSAIWTICFHLPFADKVFLGYFRLPFSYNKVNFLARVSLHLIWTLERRLNSGND